MSFLKQIHAVRFVSAQAFRLYKSYVRALLCLRSANSSSTTTGLIILHLHPESTKQPGFARLASILASVNMETIQLLKRLLHDAHYCRFPFRQARLNGEVMVQNSNLICVLDNARFKSCRAQCPSVLMSDTPAIDYIDIF